MRRWAYSRARSVYWSLQRLRNAALRRIDPPVLVLLYHRVNVLPADPERLAVSPGNFRAQIKHLKEHFRPVGFTDDWSALSEPSVCITFDDGYADNALEALPILEELGVPATFFISTGHLGSNREYWWDELARLLLHARGCPAVFTLADPRHGRGWPTATLAQRQRLYETLSVLAKAVDRERLESWLAQLRAWAGVREPGSTRNRSMTAGELKALASSRLVTVGAHTVTHPVLAGLSEAEQRSEIIGSKERLEGITDTEVRGFSYPFGNRTHYDRTSIRICREAGFLRAAANFPGQVHRWTDPYQLPRQVVRDWDARTFARHLRNWL